MREVEHRITSGVVDVRASQDGPGHIWGYAAKYNTLSQNLGGFVETIAPGAFDKAVADSQRVMCRYLHNNAYLLGTTEAGTVILTPDEIGLRYDCDLPDTSAGRDVAVLTARRDVRYSSFAFICIEDEWTVTEQGFPLRRLVSLRLVDVAPVNEPAYLDTSVAKRSLEDFMSNSIERRDLPTDVQAKLQGLLATMAGADAALDPVASAIRSADDALDAGQATISEILGQPNPDADAEPPAVELDHQPEDSEQRDTHSEALAAIHERRSALDGLK
jgi:hypothetical protein